MVFSSPTFLFLFLPLLLAVYAVTPRVLKNLLLLAASLVFYAWGEGVYTLVMVASISLNYVAGLLLERTRGRPSSRVVLTVAIASNLGLLGVFKYANFVAGNLNVVLTGLGWRPLAVGPVHLPIGISFFTFHALSYVIDVYRRVVRGQRNPIDLALYVTLFPQLIAGPILRYHDLAPQLPRHPVGREDFAYGVRRFIVGLGKKVLIANTLGLPADQIFALPPGQLGPGVAWLGVVCYALQIYFDFSGYSDMAVGLGRFFGFHILENFNYPYIAVSLRDFWRRWHISLSNWFRDYLYIPLGGSRGAPWRTYVNLVTVFFLCGLWHGASWTFVIWGLLHGLFLMVERLGFEARLRRAPRALQHAYVLAALVLTWTLFRAPTLPYACALLRAALGAAPSGAAFASVSPYLTPDVVGGLVAGIVGSTPVLAWLQAHGSAWGARRPPAARSAWSRLWWPVLRDACLLGLLTVSVEKVCAGGHNPFIYYRF